MYACDVCGGKADLREMNLGRVRMGAVVCDECGEVYPSFYIDPAFRLKMQHISKSDLNKERVRLLKAHEKDFNKWF